MFSIYDLYDLSAVFTLIREKPSYEQNETVLENILEVFSYRNQYHTHNQIREALQLIPELDRNMYHFVQTLNVYSYTPGFLKDERVYAVLIKATEQLLRLIKYKQFSQVVSLADCLHNLPIDIAEHKFVFPESYWHTNFAYYRKTWDHLFLKDEEKLFKINTIIL